MDRQTDRQADNRDSRAPSVGWGSKNKKKNNKNLRICPNKYL